GECSGEEDCIVEIPANRQVYAQATAEGFIEKQSEAVSVDASSTQFLSLGLLPSALQNTLRVDYEGVRLAGSKEQAYSKAVTSLSRASFYLARFSLNIPHSEKSGIFVRVEGKGVSAEQDTAYIYAFDAPENAVIERAATYSPSGKCSADIASENDYSGRPLKWVNAELKNEAGSKAFTVRFFVAANASPQDAIRLFYRAYAKSGDIWVRSPADADLGNKESVAAKDSCYAEANSTKFSVNAGKFACGPRACISLQFAKDDSSPRAFKGFVADLGQPFGIYFGVRALDDFDSPYIKITTDAGDGSPIKLNEFYLEGDALPPSSGDAGGAAFVSIPIESLQKAQSIEGSVVSAGAIPVPYSRIQVEFGDANGPVMTASGTVSVQGTGIIVMQVDPLTLKANEDKALVVALNNNADGSPLQDAAVSIEEGDDAVFEGSAPESIVGDGKSGSGAGGVYKFKKVHPLGPGKFAVIASREGFRDSSKQVAATLNDFLEASTESLFLQCDGASMEVSSKLNAKVKVFATSNCATIAGGNSMQASDTSWEIPLDAKSSATLTLTPFKQGAGCSADFSAQAPNGIVSQKTVSLQVSCADLVLECEGDEQCPDDKPKCNLTTNSCYLPAVPRECESDQPCLSRDMVCNLQTGACIPKPAQCTAADPTCPSRQRCDLSAGAESGVCVDLPVPCTMDAQCFNGQTCNAGNGMCTSKQCTGDTDCGAPSLFCDYAVNRCSDRNEHLPCAPENFDTDCPDGQRCDPATESCIRVPTLCDSKHPCPSGTGQSCDGRTKTCQPLACIDPAQCLTYQTCDPTLARCAPKQCGAGMPLCPSGSECNTLTSKCQQILECSATKPCPPGSGTVCDLTINKCVVPAPPSQECSRSGDDCCIEDNGDKYCDNGLRCADNGKCEIPSEQTCTRDVDCGFTNMKCDIPSGETSGTCRYKTCAELACAIPTVCNDATHSCVIHQCVDDASCAAAGKPAYTCVNNKCVPHYCTASTDCPAEWHCNTAVIPGQCIPPACTDSKPCPSLQYCEANLCALMSVDDPIADPLEIYLDDIDMSKDAYYSLDSITDIGTVTSCEIKSSDPVSTSRMQLFIDVECSKTDEKGQYLHLLADYANHPFFAVDSTVQAEPDTSEYDPLCLKYDVTNHACTDSDGSSSTLSAGSGLSQSFAPASSQSLSEPSMLSFADDTTGYSLVHSGRLRIMRENKASKQIIVNVYGKKPVVSSNDAAGYAVIKITSTGFVPLRKYVEPGQGVMWVNRDSVPRKIQSRETKASNGEFHSDLIPPNGNYTHNFTDAGVWGYRDDTRKNYEGTIYVGPPGQCTFLRRDNFAKRFARNLVRPLLGYVDYPGKGEQIAASSPLKFYIGADGSISTIEPYVGGLGYAPGIQTGVTNQFIQPYNINSPANLNYWQLQQQRQLPFNQNFQQGTDYNIYAEDKLKCQPSGNSFTCPIPISPLLPTNGMAFSIVNDYALISGAPSNILIDGNSKRECLEAVFVDRQGIDGALVGVMQ
ncbi:MAG: hypothetical protein V1708_03050, partial [Candidatus Micrarchaeota archaeon]